MLWLTGRVLSPPLDETPIGYWPTPDPRTDSPARAARRVSCRLILRRRTITRIRVSGGPHPDEPSAPQTAERSRCWA
jgi:hypothetical protein